MEEEAEETSPETRLLQKHKKEKKELQGKISPFVRIHPTEYHSMQCVTVTHKERH